MKARILSGLGIKAAIVLTILFAASAITQAQNANGPIRILVGSSAGGAADLLGRTIAQGLSKYLPRGAFVENRTGAAGNNAIAELARATPDGSTIGLITVATHGINPTLFGSKLPFNAVNDFAPITLVGDLQTVFVVHPSVPAKTLGEFVKYVNSHQGKVLFGSAGIGTSLHLSGELFNKATNARMVHVPYRGTSKAMPDLLAGRIQAMFIGAPHAYEQVSAGKLRALAVPLSQRISMLPDVPTFTELGYKDFIVKTWFGLAAPRGTLASIVDQYNAAVKKVLADKELRQKFMKLGIDLQTDTPQEFSSFIKSEIAKWKPIVEESGAKK